MEPRSLDDCVLTKRDGQILFRWGAVFGFCLGVGTSFFAMALTSTAQGAALDEVNLWRSQNGLVKLQEDPELTEFAQRKAEYRAARLLQNGHHGPPCPAGCTEGTGEATPDWGWLTCVQDSRSARVGGAGVAIGADGQRYMVLLLRGTNHQCDFGNNLKPIGTAHLTPDAPVIPTLRRDMRQTGQPPICPQCGRRHW